MTLINATMQRWFTQRLITEQNVSPHTLTAYRDTIRLLLSYVHDHHHRSPNEVDFNDLDAPVIGAFLSWLETDRHVSISTRNARRAALRSFFTYASFNHPEHAEQIARVLAVPAKRAPIPDITFLSPTEINALTAAPNPATRTGRRDRCLLTVAIQTGLRVSELVSLRRHDLTFGAGGHLECDGKGRKHRAVPITTHTQQLLTSWLAEHTHQHVFTRSDGQPLTRDAVRRIVDRHTLTAQKTCPTIAVKSMTPHVLRHTCAMQLLRADVDIAVIALILGHAGIETTRAYLHADHDIKQRALDRLTPPDVQLGRYRPPDNLLAFLNSL